jgi:peptidoglycan/LPS O-acetylase OafA/YrhL
MSEFSDQMTRPKYRPDIDGLRAVAVLSVLAFHLGWGRVAGGFVGVDVFFVISGYLISAIVFSEVAGSSFSVVAFYERRIRRIFPALFGMLIVFSIVASFYLLPTEFVDFAKSLLAAATSSSNFYFWKHSGYFDSPTSSPLLHTWSLAVEEQFYILFPIFLVVVRRFFPGAAAHRRGRSVHCLADDERCDGAHRLSRRVLYALHPGLGTAAGDGAVSGHVSALAFTPDAECCYPRGNRFDSFFGCDLQHAYTVSGIGGVAAMHRVSADYWSRRIWSVPGGRGAVLAPFRIHWTDLLFALSLALAGNHPARDGTVGQFAERAAASVTPTDLAAFRFDMYMEIVFSFVLAILSWRFVERPFRSRPLRVGRRPLFALSAGAMVLP